MVIDKQELAMRQALGTNNIGSAKGSKYSLEELKVLAEGVFKDSPGERCFYADEFGTFKNEIQFDALSEDEQKAFTIFENPVAPAPDATAAKVETLKIKLDEVSGQLTDLQSKHDELAASYTQAQADLTAANKEIARLNDLKNPSAAKALQAQLDAANAKIAELTASPAPQP
jgi:outer membrane murein-binding lipoprotein Lpp